MDQLYTPNYIFGALIYFKNIGSDCRSATRNQQID